MKIKPKYTTFEQSCLLKQKEFNELVFCYYTHNKEFIEPSIENGSSTDCDFSVDLQDLLENHNSQYSQRVSAPEQWQVIEWLRVVHGIWISVAVFVKRDNSTVWIYDIFKNNYIVEQLQRSKGFETPQEAYSAAFNYVLKELI